MYCFRNNISLTLRVSFNKLQLLPTVRKLIYTVSLTRKRAQHCLRFIINYIDFRESVTLLHNGQLLDHPQGAYRRTRFQTADRQYVCCFRGVKKLSTLMCSPRTTVSNNLSSLDFLRYLKQTSHNKNVAKNRSKAFGPIHSVFTTTLSYCLVALTHTS